jgi:16S rRNA (guanine966-N2)-methyltransferase
MRIVAGEWGGRRLVTPAGRMTRPTTDRVREAWAMVLHDELPGARVVDLCAGSGALGLEALSRGAAHCDFVETDPRALAALRQNVAALGAAPRVTIHREDALRFLGPAAAEPPGWTIAFCDPPYASDLGPRVVARWHAAPFARILGVEHAARDDAPPGGTTRRYGDSAITFYRADG